MPLGLGRDLAASFARQRQPRTAPVRAAKSGRPRSAKKARARDSVGGSSTPSDIVQPGHASKCGQLSEKGEASASAAVAVSRAVASSADALGGARRREVARIFRAGPRARARA